MHHLHLDEEAEKLKEVVLCGPQHLPKMMKEVMLLEKFQDPKVEDESLKYLCLLLRAYDLIFKFEWRQ